MTSPWGETWNPPRDFGAEKVVLRAKTCLKGQFFVNQHKKVKQQPYKAAVFKERHVSENQALTENGAHHRYVHRISDITIQSGNDQMAGWEDRRGRAHALHCESDKRIQEANDPQRDQHAASKTEKRHPEERSFEPPTGDPPGRQTGYEPGGDDQEDRGANDHQHLPSHVLMQTGPLAMRNGNRFMAANSRVTHSEIGLDVRKRRGMERNPQDPGRQDWEAVATDNEY